MRRQLVEKTRRTSFLSLSHLSFRLALPSRRRLNSLRTANRTPTRRSSKLHAAVMQGSASTEGLEKRGSDGRGGDAAAPSNPTDSLDLDEDPDALSSPPIPAAPEPHAALAILCRKAAAEAVSSINSGEAEDIKDKNSNNDLEATLALGRLALVLSSSSSSSSSPSTSSSSTSTTLREEYLPLLNAALAAAAARRALGAALVQVCRKARTQDGRGPFDDVTLEAAELIDAGGAPVEFATEHGDTPLTVAASGGSPQLVRLLLDRGADPNGNAKACTPPIHAAIEGAGVDAFGEIFGSHGECVRILLEAGADPHARDVPPGQVEAVKQREGGNLNEHWSALHRAALRGLPEICSLLLLPAGGGAGRGRAPEPDVFGPCGQTPLDLAVYRRHSEVVKVLRAAGATGRRPRPRKVGEEEEGKGASSGSFRSSSSRGCVVS